MRPLAAFGERKLTEQDVSLMACKVLVKEMAANTKEQRRQRRHAQAEVDVMRLLTRAAPPETPIVRMCGLYPSSDGRPCLAMELCCGGSLLDHMNTRWVQKQNMTGSEVAPMLYAIAKAHYLFDSKGSLTSWILKASFLVALTE